MARIESSSYVVTQFFAYFVFFYIGYVAAPLVFRIVSWAEQHVEGALVGLVFWAITNGALVYSPEYAILLLETKMGLAALLHFALAVAGAIALCVAGGLLKAAEFCAGKSLKRGLRFR